jgi:hypothetical protein
MTEIPSSTPCDNCGKPANWIVSTGVEEYVWCDDCHEDERNEHDAIPPLVDSVGLLFARIMDKRDGIGSQEAVDEAVADVMARYPSVIEEP